MEQNTEGPYSGPVPATPGAERAAGYTSAPSVAASDAVLVFKEFYKSIDDLMGSTGDIPEQEAKPDYKEGFQKYADAVADVAVAGVMQRDNPGGTLQDKIGILFSAMKYVADETLENPRTAHALSSAYETFRKSIEEAVKAEAAESTSMSPAFLQAVALKSLMFGYQTLMVTKGVMPEQQKPQYAPAEPSPKSPPAGPPEQEYKTGQE